MTPYHVGQLALLALLLALVAERCRALMFRAALDPQPLLVTIQEHVAQGQWEQASRLVDAAQPSWFARLALPMLNAARVHVPMTAAVEEVWIELRNEGGKRLYAIRGLGSTATALGLLGVVLEFGDVIGAPGGPDASATLEAQQRAVEHAITAMAIGLTTSTLSFASLRLLRRWLAQLATELRSAAATLDTLDEASVPT